MNSRLCTVAVVTGFALSAIGGIHDEPDGVAINIDDNGGYKIISIGTGVYDFNDPDDVLNARKEAERNAKVAIVKFFKESMATEESAASQMSKVKKYSSDGESENSSVSKTTAKETLSQIRSSASKLLTGIVVLEDEKVPSGNKGGICRVMVGVSSTTIKGASSVGNAVTDGGASHGNSSIGDASGSVANSVPTESACTSSEGRPPVPEGWTVCVGIGDERKVAVRAALIEGISQVYGQLLQNDERQIERMNKLKVQGNVLGNDIDMTLKTQSKVSQSETLTKTAGFVREYRVIQVVPKDGNYEATVYAFIVNPRAGGTVALMVKRPTMSITDRTTIYQIGKKRMSGTEVAKAVQFALPSGLAKANKFLILNDKSLSTVIENKVTTEAMVVTGLAGAQELMQAGQGLTPDFSLQSEIKDIKYSKKLGMDKKTKKIATQYKMSVVLDVTLMNDRTGQAVKSDSITLAMDNDEIAGILEVDEDADLLSAILTKLAEPVEEWIGGK